MLKRNGNAVAHIVLDNFYSAVVMKHCIVMEGQTDGRTKKQTAYCSQHKRRVVRTPTPTAAQKVGTPISEKPQHFFHISRMIRHFQPTAVPVQDTRRSISV